MRLLKLDSNNGVHSDFHAFCQKNDYLLSEFFVAETPKKSIREIYRMDGRDCHVSWKWIPFNLPDKKLKGTLLIGYDVTECVSAFDELHEKVFFYENILSKLPSNVYWKNRDCVYMGCNDRLAHVMGLPSREAIKGMTDFDFPWSRAASESFIAFDKKVMESGVPGTTEDVFKEANGKTVTVLTSKTPLKNEAGETTGILAISVDITEKKQLEERLREASLREERLKVLSSMGGMIAHELRTPITAMSLSADSIKKYLPTLMDVYKKWSEEKGERLISPIHLKGLTKACDSILNSLNQADETVNMILNGFKPNQLAKENLKEVSYDELIDSMLEEYPLSPKQLELITIKKSSLVHICCNKRTVVYVLTNLLKNALYYINQMDKGTISIWAEQKVDTISLYVKDTAKGISSDQLDKIFEPFYTSKYVGTSIGMGLYFCKMALESMGAKIVCRSVLGEFTEFTLVFPKKLRSN